jgi:uncharacterized protein (TIGR02246 family)
MIKPIAGALASSWVDITGRCCFPLLLLVFVLAECEPLEPFPVKASPAEAHAAAAGGTHATNKANQPAPENIIKNLVLAWNRGDSRAIAGLFLPDGVLVTPTGSVIQSRGEIQKTIAKERQGRLKDTILKNSVDDVSLVDANTAVVKGKYQLEGMKIMGVATSPAGSYIVRQKKQQGRWMIAKAEIVREKTD